MGTRKTGTANTDFTGGAKRNRTVDPLHAMQVLYQLSYSPINGEAEL